MHSTRTRVLPWFVVLAFGAILPWVSSGLVGGSRELAENETIDASAPTVSGVSEGRTNEGADEPRLDAASSEPLPSPEPNAVPDSTSSSEQPVEAAKKIAPARVRVVLELPEEAGAVGLPEPELLRVIGEDRLEPLVVRSARQRHPALELARRSAAGLPPRDADVASLTFEVAEPGRYVPAWSLWCQVQGTSTWRVVRGRGPEVRIDPAQGDRELLHRLRASDLVLDATIDARAPDAKYRVTAKDG